MHEEPVVLRSHDPAWKYRFEKESKLLERSIGRWIVGGIHHIGSTAVPGLEAKPIIDILVGVRGLEATRPCFEPLAELGYLYAPYRAEEMHWFCKPHPARRTHHLHLVPVDSQRYREELEFRDRLRGEPDVAAEYTRLKRQLAEKHRDDREAYTEGKGDFIRRVMSGG